MPMLSFANGPTPSLPEPVRASPVKKVSELASAPLYEVVKRQISELIVMGTWPPGTVLPSEVSLAQEMGVAVGTIRRALLDLAAEGLLARRRKTGTVVTGRSAHHGLRVFFQYFRLQEPDGSLVTSSAKVLDVKPAKADKNIRKWLQLPERTTVIHLRRLRFVNGAPVMVDHFVIPAERVPDFPLVPSEVPELLYAFLLDRFGIRVTAVREQLSAEVATPEDRKMLHLKAPAAILKIEEVSFDQMGAPTIYSVRRATTKNHLYINEIR